MPEVFEAFEHVLLTFFKTIGSILSFAENTFSNGSLLPNAAMIPGIPN
jgi:hypothetical protein